MVRNWNILIYQLEYLEQNFGKSIGEYVVVDDRVYYTDLDDGYKLYSYGLEDRKSELISDSNARYLTAEYGYLYYSNFNDDESLYLLEIETLTEEKLLSRRVHNLNVTGEIIMIDIETTDGSESVLFNKSTNEVIKLNDLIK